ncbi:MAG TPA: bifunctional phosphoribosylaminoimidazolecarboxamide formyltransferase/inosine monophosphate cyclohydrolase, partial [Cyanothece sp. UBA12306]|nr:bifunctional phosphoribosylaminoimidazolecarboxamide formyltransferase/inosine monophosphate cyclohydrolase [Cyanothece sp. UBA12306]
MARLALLSVSDKTGIIDLAQQLVEKFGFDLISSGGTAKALQTEGLPVTKVSDYTQSPEILEGRVKTLHPRIHGGILGRRDLPQDIEEMESNQIRPIDLVVVNLYPFEQTIANPNVTVAEAIEKIDIGGPTLLRAAAKNYAHVTVLSNPKYYQTYLAELAKNNGKISLEFRQKMAGETFALTHGYDGAITNYFMSIASEDESSLTSRFTVSGTQFQSLRYGENPHQEAVWYQTRTQPSGWTSATKLQGKELSYNNLVDLEAARRIIAEFQPEEPAVAILKHTNPCGTAVGNTLADAYEKAFNADSISAFGGIVAVNQPLDQDTATLLTKTFLECVVAPGCDEAAKAILTAKSKVRVLLLPDLIAGPKQTVKVIAGGLLVQSSDDAVDTPDSWKIATEKQPTPEQLAELLFAWKVAKHVKSNAIVVTKNRTTLGIGAGQMNRVGAVKIALEEA